MGHTSGAGAAPWAFTFGVGQHCRRADLEPGPGIWIWGGTVGVHIWSWDSTKGKRTWAQAPHLEQGQHSRRAHLEPAQHIWVWCSVPPDRVRCGYSPAPRQPQRLPGMGVAVPLSCWFPCFPVWFVHTHHQPLLVPVKLMSSYLFLSGHGELRLSAQRQPALGQGGRSTSAHAWLFPMPCSSLC